MWRLIRAELGYLKYFIYAVSLLILVHGFSKPIDMYEFHNGYLYVTHSPIQSLSDGIAYLLPLHLIVIFVLLYLYVRESRLRQYVAMPVRKGQIILARLATPILLAAIFIFISLIPLIIVCAFFPKDLIAYYHSILRHYSDTIFVYNHFGQSGEYGQFLNSRYYYYEKSLAIIGLMMQMILFFTYAFWLFSERFGWYLLGGYFVFVVYHNGILPLFNPQLAWAISDFIQNSYSSSQDSMGIHISLNMLYASIGFIVLIAISFYTRRSFMR
jgi:hypothetical protein